MDLRNVFLFVLLSVGSMGSLHFIERHDSNTCDINKLCEGITDGSIVYDPFECHNYYYCLANGPSDSFPCADGEYFDADSNNCTEEMLPCEDPCSHYCHTMCEGNVTYIPDGNDCGVYYSCEDSSQPLLCPSEEPYFNGYNCTAAVEDCCIACAAYCFEEDIAVEIYDPLDCRSYYLCMEPGIPEEHGTCPDGEIFDRTEERCVLGNECENFCFSGTSTTGTITSTATESSTETTAPTATEPSDDTTEPTTASSTQDFTTTIPPSLPPPNCDTGSLCDGMPNGTLVADPWNCHNFYICENYQILPLGFTCDEGDYFNEDACVPEDEPCYPLCVQRCDLFCVEGSPPISIPDPTNCTLYYYCNNGSPGQVQTCNNFAPYFDGTNCVQNAEKCCSPCVPYCYDDNLSGNVFDPYDCTSYYQCNGEGVPTIKRSCSVGEIFDYASNECVRGTNCTNYCYVQEF